MFFSLRDKETAVGMHTLTYFLMLAVYLSLITIGLLFSRKMRKDIVDKLITFIAIFIWVTEIVKMIFYGFAYGIKEIEIIPLYYCSMFLYATVMTKFKNEKIKRSGMAFMAFGGVVGALCFFAFPSSVIPNYHVFHFMTLRTMIFHSLMIYLGVLILITGYYKPQKRDFHYYIVFFLIVFFLAYFLNMVKDDNLMYISKPLDIQIVKDIYNLIPHLYPFIFGFVNCVAPYAISYGCYLFIQNKNSHQQSI